MTLFSYEIFDAVARQGSFNKAAQQLHLTPSAISHAIAVMEAELGFTLFNRGKNGVTMTSYGASLYPSIRAVLNSDEALQQRLRIIVGNQDTGRTGTDCIQSGQIPRVGAAQQHTLCLSDFPAALLLRTHICFSLHPIRIFPLHGS